MLSELKKALLGWARANGVLADNVPLTDAGDISLVPFPEGAADYFRTRKIVRVVVDEDNNTVILFSRLSIAQAKQKILREAFDTAFAAQNIRLRLDAIKPFKIDNAVESYGFFEPVKRYGARICCGSSLGLGNQRNAGTLTAFARKKGDPETLYGISCNHVTGGCSTARPGTPIVVPGIQDVSETNNEIETIGDHESAARMGQGLPSVYPTARNRDLAYFRVRNPKRVTSLQGTGADKFDTPTSFAKSVAGMPVKKWGRSTGLTTGIVNLVNRDDEPIEYNVQSYFGPMNSQFFRGTVYFNNVIEVTPTGRPFSLAGDSGALVVTDFTNKNNKVVGIVIAGGREKSLVLPLRPALDDLDLVLISKHNC